MQPCPECDFLMEADADECKFCGSPPDSAEPVDDVRSAAVVAMGFHDEDALQAAEAALADELGTETTALEPFRTGMAVELARGAAAEDMPYLAEGTPAATHRSPKVVAVGVAVAVCVALAGAGWWTVSRGGDGAAGNHPARSIRAVPGAASAQASSTTVVSVASTTSLLPKTALGGRTVAIGEDGRFGATMPAGTTQTSTSSSATTWAVTLPGGSRLAFTALRSTSIADRYKNSIGRLAPLLYAEQVDADLGVTGRTPSDAAFPAGPGAEWAIVGGGRISVVDAGELVFVVSLRHAGEVLPSSDFAAYLAVVASIHTS